MIIKDKNINPKTQKHKKTKNHKKKTKAKTKINQASSNIKTRKKKKGKRETEKRGWSPVVSGALCMGVRSAQFESCMKPGVCFMGLGTVPWTGW